MIKIVFNFKYIYMYARMHVLHALKKLILPNYLYFLIKILFTLYAFMHLHGVTC